MNLGTMMSRTLTSAALAVALGLGAAPGAQAAAVPVADKVGKAGRADNGGGWQGEGGLALNAADNARVDAFVEQAKRAERSISPQVRAAALLSSAELVGFDHRLKSPDSLKRKVATSMKEHPGQNVNEALSGINDSVRYTLRWPDGRYTEGVTVASRLLSVWGNDSIKWTNTWGRAKGYKAINSGWSAARSGHRFEVQFHTPASKNAQEVTHKLYEEQRLPGTSPERARELQAQQDAIFAAVPVPQGADRLTAPGPVRAPVAG
ncbi:ATP nucleotide 3'-pyrophosphokinase [Streptomyces sp. NPDC053048]|uniref:ATP nucleotide 3'-pyrophosphokinase n=1 Tax=Streptomyces sp. NPDC053048 TaxID=3365694 RepID=UPI0037D8A0FF